MDDKPYRRVEDAYCGFEPSLITMHLLNTGEQIEELSLIAIETKIKKRRWADQHTGEISVQPVQMVVRLLATGRAALEYQDTPGVIVGSPLREGQIADCYAVGSILKNMIHRFAHRPRILKPVIYIRTPDGASPIEEQTIINVAFLGGARKVFLYHGPMSEFLKRFKEQKKAPKGFVIDIEPPKHTSNC